MKVLFTSPVLAHPSTNGPQLRVENSIKALAANCGLHVVMRAVSSPQEQARAAEYFRAYCREFVVAPRLNRAAPAGRVLRRLDMTWRALAESDSREDAQLILDHADRHGIGILWFGYGNISYPLMRRIRALRPDLKLVCDTDSVWSRFVLRELPYAKDWRRRLSIARAGRRKQREERAWVELCDVTTAVSTVDAEYYQSLTDKRDRIRLFPNAIDLESYRDRPARLPGFHNPSICLSGSFGYYHSPMDTAARWVLEEILPQLLRRRPDLHFYIIGSGSEKGFGHLNGPGITVTGRVPSVLPYLCHADVALVPLHFESGTRFKILEAGACGIPLVSTTLGAEGIPVLDGRDILLADQPGAFAAAILRLLDDKALASRLAANCRQLVQEQFSVERLRRDAREILDDLIRSPAPALAG